MRVIGPTFPLLTGLVLSSCASAGNSPVIPFLGAYFPSWIACSLIGIIGTVVLRLVFIKIGLDDIMPMRVVAYLFLAIAIGLASSLILFGR